MLFASILLGINMPAIIPADVVRMKVRRFMDSFLIVDHTIFSFAASQNTLRFSL